MGTLSTRRCGRGRAGLNRALHGSRLARHDFFFDFLDRDGSGALTIEDFYPLVAKEGPCVDDVRAEAADRFFDLSGAGADHSYMGFVVPVWPGAGLDAVTHVDGTARVQTLREEQTGEARRRCSTTTREAWLERTASSGRR